MSASSPDSKSCILPTLSAMTPRLRLLVRLTRRTCPSIVRGRLLTEAFMQIKPQRSFGAIDALLEKTTRPEHRAMLENFKAHMTAEISCDIDGIMATMSP